MGSSSAYNFCDIRRKSLTKFGANMIKLRVSGGFRHVQHVRPNRDPQKRGPTRGAANFLQYSNMPEIMGDSDDQKKSPVFFQEK